ncbi:MAG: hypothetical protein RR280_05820, partial [Bacteroidaceae bacterium]
AEQCFRMAERMTPGIMTPRFLLFCLYRESGKDALPPAIRTADMRVKIENESVCTMRNEARRYIRSVGK